MAQLNKTKPLAIAKLKNGESISSIAEELNISTSLIQEWAETLSPEDKIAKEVNTIAIQKATDIVKVTEINNADKLQTTLLALAISLTDEIKVGCQDYAIARALNTSADTIAKLQNAFFGKGTQIAVINTNTDRLSEELKTFRGVLRE